MNSQQPSVKEVNRVIEEIEAKQKRRQNKLKNKAKKLISFFPTWFTQRRRKQQYFEWLQIRTGELTLQTLELQIMSLKEELKDYREMKKLDRHVHKWQHKQRYVE